MAMGACQKSGVAMKTASMSFEAIAFSHSLGQLGFLIEGFVGGALEVGVV